MQSLALVSEQADARRPPRVALTLLAVSRSVTLILFTSWVTLPTYALVSQVGAPSVLLEALCVLTYV